MTPVDFKKTEKQFYQPGSAPVIVEVPQMVFFAVDGKGDPNTSAAYQAAIEVLYALSYAVKMSKKGDPPAGYFDYVVPPLEGLWDGYAGIDQNNLDKAKFRWTSMIRQPEFVTDEVFEFACQQVAKKKPALDLSEARRMVFEEGLCAQVLHVGPYDDEPATVAVLDAFIAANGHQLDYSPTRWHHEIYLSDPRKSAPEKLKTIIRHPIRKIALK
jgi:hypothetical protein